ncbi:IS5 family transposase [Streptomyces sp. NPDC045251]|uniref:IS5 family transposase n=1 Tax=unclassified Streptomyces TaxID=2593676 RepID=UPI0033F4BED0
MRSRRYPSDTTNAEWTLIEPLLPTPACETSAGGRPEKHPRREIVDAIRYVVDTGCKWRALPADFPPWRTVWGFMARWAACGVIGQIRDHLSGRIRRDLGKGPRAVATVIDSQSVKAAETISKATRGYDAGKKINGRKRHLVVDTRGLPLLVMVTPADLHDSAAAKEVLFRLRLMHPEITIVWADSAYAGKLVDWAKQHLNLTIKPVSRPKDASGFVVLPPPVGRRTQPCVDDARTPPRQGLRTAHPALRDPDHLGSHHSHDQAQARKGATLSWTGKPVPASCAAP